MAPRLGREPDPGGARARPARRRVARPASAGARRERRVRARRAARRRPRPRTGEAGARRPPARARAPASSDERAIEIPWASPATRESDVLDVGSAFAEPAYLAGLARSAPRSSSASTSPSPRPSSPTFAHCRSTPALRPALCISTLEHVGHDNEVYDVDGARDETGTAAALASCVACSRATGGCSSACRPACATRAWVVAATPARWIALFEHAGFVVFEDELYVHADDGWRTATLGEARGSGAVPERPPARCSSPSSGPRA